MAEEFKIGDLVLYKSRLKGKIPGEVKKVIRDTQQNVSKCVVKLDTCETKVIEVQSLEKLVPDFREDVKYIELERARAKGSLSEAECNRYGELKARPRCDLIEEEFDELLCLESKLEDRTNKSAFG